MTIFSNSIPNEARRFYGIILDLDRNLVLVIYKVCFEEEFEFRYLDLKRSQVTNFILQFHTVNRISIHCRQYEVKNLNKKSALVVEFQDDPVKNVGSAIP